MKLSLHLRKANLKNQMMVKHGQLNFVTMQNGLMVILLQLMTSYIHGVEL